MENWSRDQNSMKNWFQDQNFMENWSGDQNSLENCMIPGPKFMVSIQTEQQTIATDLMSAINE